MAVAVDAKERWRWGGLGKKKYIFNISGRSCHYSLRVKVLIIMILTFLRTANTLNVILFDISLNVLQKGFFVSNFRALVLRCCFCVCRRCGFFAFWTHCVNAAN